MDKIEREGEERERESPMRVGNYLIYIILIWVLFFCLERKMETSYILLYTLIYRGIYIYVFYIFINYNLALKSSYSD